MLKIGSLCSGYGGLDMALEAFFKAQTVWMSDIDKASSLAIEKNWQLPNLGDLKTIDWTNAEKIDILSAGYPCQPFSAAGKREGSNDKRHLWPNIYEVIGHIRPRLVFLENVRGHLSLGFKEVLQDLAQIGYSAKWTIVRASDVGAPHRRERLFVAAHPDGQTRFPARRANQGFYGSTSEIIDGSNRNEYGGGIEIITNPDHTGRFGNTEKSRVRYQSSFIGNTNAEQLQTNGQASGLGWRFETPFELWMRRTPDPLDNDKLNPRFVEYMMGLPEGWVTDLPISRSQQFKLLGNGVVPQQAFKALQLLCDSGHNDHDTPKG